MTVPTAFPTATATATTREAERLLELGRFDGALQAWQAIAAADPASPRAQARIGTCLVALGRHDEARTILEPLVVALPDQPMLRYRLALARAGCGDPAAALEALDAAAAAGLRPMAGAAAEPVLAGPRADPQFGLIAARIERNAEPTSIEAEFRSFDFWVGTWDARTEDGALQGRNRIERVLGGAALVERWTGATGYCGTSLNRYDRRTGTWRQTWVDDQGDIVEFEKGVAAAGRVVFQATDPDGGRRRLTFEDRGPDAFRQVSETSPDGGLTWVVEYDFRYERVATDDAGDGAGPG